MIPIVHSQHAPFAPSSMAITMVCPGSWRMRKLYPDLDDSPKAMEGTAAHWVASEMLSNRIRIAGELTPNGVAVTDEMLDGAELYYDAVAPYITGARIETSVTCSAIHKDCWGTPDLSKMQPTELFISDYKFGHRHVEVFENWQLLAYASGLIKNFWHGNADMKVIMQVVQPRSYHRDGPVRTWEMTLEELIPYWAKMTDACIAAEQPDAPCIPSVNCLDCSANHACSAFQRSATSALDIADRSAPLELTPEATGLELQLIDWAMERLTARRSGLSEQAYSLIRNKGIRVPGYAVEPTSAREGWNKPISEVIALGKMMGIDISKSAALTPKQAVKAGLPRELVSAYACTPAGALKLVPSNEQQLRKVFG